MFYVENADGVNDVVPTTSPRGFGLSVLLWALLLAVRNMVISGSPLDYEPRERLKVQEQTAMGQVVPSNSKKISRKTRPDQRRRRGKRKR